MEKGPVHSCSSFIHHTGLEVHQDGARDMFPVPSLLEEGGEGVISGRFIAGHHPVRSDAMLEAVELPAGITNLDSGLADVNTEINRKQSVRRGTLQ